MYLLLTLVKDTFHLILAYYIFVMCTQKLHYCVEAATINTISFWDTKHWEKNYQNIVLIILNNASLGNYHYDLVLKHQLECS